MLKYVLMLLLTFTSYSAQAQGAFDFLDPCIDGKKKYKSSSEALRSGAERSIQEWKTMAEPPGEIRGLYVEAIREAAFHAWSNSAEAAPLLAQLKAADPKFNPKTLFTTEVYPKAVTPDAEANYVRQLFRADVDSNILPALQAQKVQLEADINKSKADLDKSCKKDVVAQFSRATIGNLTLMLGGNIAAAKNESGDIAKFIRASSGVSIGDIQKHGIRGGEGSALSKLLGSKDSVASQLVAALDPLKWKIPPIKVDPPTVTLPGNVRICLPWC